MRKKILSFIMALMLLTATMSTSVFALPAASTAPALTEVNSEIVKTANYIAAELGKSGGDNELELSSYPYIFYLQRSGIECSELVNKYLGLVAGNINSDGKLLYEDSELLGYYAMVLLIMGLADVDATNFNGTNLVKNFEDKITSDNYDTYYNGDSYTYNPYELSYAVYAIKAYSHKMENPAGALAKLKTALLNTIFDVSPFDPTSEGPGVDNYGINPDNNAKVLSALKYFYHQDNEVKSKVDSVIAWTKSRIQEDGTSLYYATYNGEVFEYPSSSSTGLTLALLATYADSDAATSYYGAMSYKSTSVEGAFDAGYGVDFGYSAKDIMEGMLSYGRLLAGKTDLYDISDVFSKVNSPIAIKVNNPQALPADAILTVTSIPDGTAGYFLASNTLKDIAKSFIPYDFSLLLNGSPIQPEAPISLTLDIPQGYEYPAIYYIDDQGNYTKLDATVENGRITFTASHFSTYVIVDEIQATPVVNTSYTQAPATTDNSPVAMMIIFSLLSLAVIIGSEKCRIN